MTHVPCPSPVQSHEDRQSFSAAHSPGRLIRISIPPWRLARVSQDDGILLLGPACRLAVSRDAQDIFPRRQPVVAVTAGSVAPEERALFLSYYQTSIESILACSARALVINAPENIAISEQRDEVLQLPFVPFSKVFPACAAVVHHGGIGTIAQCLRAGVPSLVVPGGLDQPFNAAQVVQLKAGM